MITRDCFGKLKASVKNYEVSKRYDGKYEIIKCMPCYKTEAVLNNPILMWNEIEPFDSLVKAYSWLKKNVDNLL